MPIRTEEPSRRSVAMVQATLARLVADPVFRRRAGIRPVTVDQALGLSTPHGVFCVEVEQLRREGLKAAEPISMRFIVLQGDRTVGSAETRLDTDGRPGSFSNVAQGAEVDGFVDGLARSEKHPRMAEENFELRVLRVNELHLQALWLRSESGRDVIVPSEPAFPPFSAGQPLEVEDFLRLVNEAAASLPDTERPVEG
jgi:hypothetical protein